MSAANVRVWASFVALMMVAVAQAAGIDAGQLSPSQPQREVGVLCLRAETVHTGSLPDLRDQTAFRSRSQLDRAVIQLDGPMTTQRHRQLTAMGVRLGDYLPNYAYVADLSKADRIGLSAAEFVVWVGPYRAAWKLDPELGQRRLRHPQHQALRQDGLAVVVVSLFHGESSDETVAALSRLPQAAVHHTELVAGNWTITATVPLVQMSEVAQWSSVQYVEEAPELVLRNSTNRWLVQTGIENVTPLYSSGITGTAEIVGLIDAPPDFTHCSFVDEEGDPIGPDHRKVEAFNAGSTPTISGHGTHVAGTLIGDAGVFDDTRGVAFGGRLVFNTLPEYNGPAVYSRLIAHYAQGARVHSNSWGDDDRDDYSSLTRGVDAFCYDYEDCLVVFAVSNYNVIKNPENAKNLLAVAASQLPPNQDSHCMGGHGPTFDGRRKPELLAPGCSTLSSLYRTVCDVGTRSGTSMACPVISGAGMLARQYYRDGFYPTGTLNPPDGFTPSGALLKATLLNAAVDMTDVEGYPNNIEGWGRVQLADTLYLLDDPRNLILRDVWNANGLATGEQAEVHVQVLDPAEKLKVTLVWTEPPATIGAELAVVNDLDLELVAPDTTVYPGNVFEDGVSVPSGEKDPLNNVEQVHVASPLVGEWTVRVKAAEVNVGLQGFALVASGAISDSGNSPMIESLASCVEHGSAGQRCLDLRPTEDSAGDIEPRLAGISHLQIQLDTALNPATVLRDHVAVNCVSGYAGTVEVGLSDGRDQADSMIRLTFDPPIGDQDCCTIELSDIWSAGGLELSAVRQVRTLFGDVNRDGKVTTSDAYLIKPHFERPVGDANFLFDINADGLITPADYLAVKPFYQHIAPQCP